MRLIIFSDLHGNQYAWRAFLQSIRKVRYDHMIFLGDVFGYYYGQEEIANGLSAMENLTRLKGNHDQFFLDLLNSKAELKHLEENYGSTYRRTLPIGEKLRPLFDRLPFSRQLKTDGLSICFCHGTPDDPSNGRRYPRDRWQSTDCRQYNVVICGHTHFRMVRKGEGKLWLNAGSLGQPRDGNKSGFLLFDTKTQEFEYIDVVYDMEPLFREIQEKDPHLYKLKEVLERELL